jgi:hypothetical protein
MAVTLNGVDRRLQWFRRRGIERRASSTTADGDQQDLHMQKEMQQARTKDSVTEGRLSSRLLLGAKWSSSWTATRNPSHESKLHLKRPRAERIDRGWEAGFEFARNDDAGPRLEGRNW